MVLQIVELDFIQQQLGGDALQSLLATMGQALSCVSLPSAWRSRSLGSCH